MDIVRHVRSVQEVAFHRNGIGGNGFYAVRFTSDVPVISEKESEFVNVPPTKGKNNANWLAILFDDPGSCAVICLDLIPTCGVKFAGGNSWRGDNFEPELREAIKNANTSGGVRIGPFCLPTE